MLTSSWIFLITVWPHLYLFTGSVFCPFPYQRHTSCPGFEGTVCSTTGGCVSECQTATPKAPLPRSCFAWKQLSTFYNWKIKASYNVQKESPTNSDWTKFTALDRFPNLVISNKLDAEWSWIQAILVFVLSVLTATTNKNPLDHRGHG
jgi:hypothetical protein